MWTLCALDSGRVRVVEGGEVEGGEVVHTKSMGKICTAQKSGITLLIYGLQT